MVSVILSWPVDVDTSPLSRVVTRDVDHATSREVVSSGKIIVVVDDNVKGGKMYTHGGMQ